jgi:hypothetical protein
MIPYSPSSVLGAAFQDALQGKLKRWQAAQIAKPESAETNAEPSPQELREQSYANWVDEAPNVVE